MFIEARASDEFLQDNYNLNMLFILVRIKMKASILRNQKVCYQNNKKK